MLVRSFIALLLAVVTVAVPVIADKLVDSEPVLRLRLTDPLLDAAPRPLLRPRFDAAITAAPVTVPMPAVTVEDAGRVGRFAYVSTPHPNIVVAIGATDDHAELGRQIDRAMTNMAPGNTLYQTRHDSAPFIGFGLRAGEPDRGWAVDATFGAGLYNQSEAARLADWKVAEQASGYDAEARANVRLRYRF